MVLDIVLELSFSAEVTWCAAHHAPLCQLPLNAEDGTQGPPAHQASAPALSHSPGP